MTPCSIIIPAFNHADLTRQCLDAVIKTVNDEVEIIVVDDCSQDETPAMLAGYGQRVRAIIHPVNRGFATTCNDGAAAASSDFLLFLNNDTIPQQGWLEALLNYAAAHPSVSMIGSKLLYPDNTLQHAGVVICQDQYPRHLYMGFSPDHPAVNKSRRFQVVTAASALVRRAAFEQAKGFDPQYRNGFEDVDFCLRLGELGHEIHYCAESVVYHFESVSPGRFKSDNHNVALYRQRWFGRVKPDDFQYYLADGLLRIEYEGTFPVRLHIAPELAVLDTATRAAAAEKLLMDRARQVAELNRENTRLRVDLGKNAPRSPALKYDGLRQRIREEVQLTVPPGSTVLVVSKGDGALLELDGCTGRHFPQTESGVYIGYHPADSAEAIAHLEKQRALGADYLLFPETAFWWLDTYADFRRHLDANYPRAAYGPNTGAIYALRPVKLAAPAKAVRVIAILAVRNEERFLARCLEHLAAQGVQAYVIDNGSTDRTLAIAESYQGRGVVGIEQLPSNHQFPLLKIMQRKEELAATLDADWFMHMDADEVHLAPTPEWTLAQGFAAAEAAGYNAVNFIEFVFIPTREEPDHDHARYLETMRWYYPFLPRCPWRMCAWKRQPQVELAFSGGHRVRFPGVRLCPTFFQARHYQFLSVAHGSRKYGRRKYEPANLEKGFHGGVSGWRYRFAEQSFPLPSQAELHEINGSALLDATAPRARHYLEEIMSQSPGTKA